MAKKRHHQSVRARENEAAGMARYEAGEAQLSKHGKFYGDPVSANPMKERVRSMIGDDRNAPCNLPQHVIEKYWPVSHDYNMGYVDDLFDGVNKQMRQDNRDMSRAMGPAKY